MLIDRRLLTPLLFFNPIHPVPSNLFFPAIDLLNETDAMCRWRRKRLVAWGRKLQ